MPTRDPFRMENEVLTKNILTKLTNFL